MAMWHDMVVLQPGDLKCRVLLSRIGGHPRYLLRVKTVCYLADLCGYDGQPAVPTAVAIPFENGLLDRFMNIAIRVTFSLRNRFAVSLRLQDHNVLPGHYPSIIKPCPGVWAVCLAELCCSSVLITGNVGIHRGNERRDSRMDLRGDLLDHLLHEIPPLQPGKYSVDASSLAKVCHAILITADLLDAESTTPSAGCMCVDDRGAVVLKGA